VVFEGAAPIQHERIVYTASGMHLGAARLHDRRAIIEHGLYWATAASTAEAQYLYAVLNAATFTELVRPFMSYGKDERHFDKNIWQLPVPLYDAGNDLHARLAARGAELESTAAGIEVDPARHFAAVRRDFREFIAASDAGRDVEELLAELTRWHRRLDIGGWVTYRQGRCERRCKPRLVGVSVRLRPGDGRLDPMSDVTRLLDAAGAGDPQAAADLLPLVYSELRRLAAARLAAETPGQTLQPTALVHEAYLRLVGDQRFDGRGHFFAAAAEAMRRILVDAARRKGRDKRGGDRRRLELDDYEATAGLPADEILALDEALTRLAADDPEAARVVQLHFFAGLSIEQTAESLGVSRATAYRQWSYARAWLRCAMGGEDDPAGDARDRIS